MMNGYKKRGGNRNQKGSWVRSRGSDDLSGQDESSDSRESATSREPANALDERQERQPPDFKAGKLTSLTVQKGNPDRLSMFVDDVFLMGVRREVAYKYGFKKDLEVTVDFLQEVWRDEEGFRARDLAAKYLGTKSRTTKQIRDYLLGKFFDEEVVERTIDWLNGLGYLDDGQFARQWVENRTRFRPRGKSMLRWELQQKGIARADIEEALTTELEGDAEIQAAVQLLQKKVGHKSIDFTSAERKKLSNHLARRGFSGSVISEAMRRFRELANLDND
ncbi:regulatory protein RecX [Tumebacillus permanentifrigoris]|uniref:Regulatory protein RecX n=1 Tax=Tumebacillus permanentifrigoris TaxID=378543 RepID=A0A316DBI6_9BACL|nr:regulatory protein RecX [Tumebacillus permanentifrigoris]PWK15497.1 regulatory protein [Tumebacillus permanentifrigoris]